MYVDTLKDCDGIHSSLILLAPLMLDSKASLMELSRRNDLGIVRGSIASFEIIDSVAGDDRETWEALRRELKEVGVSPGIIAERKEFIIAWFQDAVAAGKLDEDSLEDDEYKADFANNNQNSTPSPSDGGATTMTEVSRPTTHQSAWQPKHKRDSRSRNVRKWSRLQVSYLINRVIFRDRRFIEGAVAGDLAIVLKMLDKGADVHAITTFRDAKLTTLHLISKHGELKIAPLLLEKGAEVDAKDRLGHTPLHVAVRSWLGLNNAFLDRALIGDGNVPKDYSKLARKSN